jgi:hypothetical protein
MSADTSGAPHPAGDDAAPWAVRWWWLWVVLALATGAITVVAAGGFDIVDLELAGSVERANEAITGADLGAVRSAIYLDFAFLFFYGLALSTGSLWARRQFKGGVGSRLGIPVATAAVVAAVLDIVENLSMLGYLNGWADWSGWIPLARVVAIPKFLLVLISITYVLIGVGIWAFRSLTSRRHRE